jgi:hypothetical protein
MARVYIGDRSRVDQAVLQAVQSLPDDFWVLAEFNVGRNIDWLIIRPFPDGPSTMILTELKRQSRRIQGDENGPWQEEVAPGQWQPIIPGNHNDVNAYWQAVNTANELQQWLWNNQPRYRTDPRPLNVADTKVWPDVLILSPEGVRHLLPMKPSSGYGRWFYDIDDWMSHVIAWRPKLGIHFTHEDVRALARALSLEPLNGEIEEPGPSLDAGPLDIAERLRTIERRLEDLESKVAGTAPPTAPVRSVADGRPELTEELRDVIRDAVQQVRRTGRSRATPSILSAIQAILGYDLKQTGYNGFGTATAFFEEARSQGIVKFGPNLGPNATIFLVEEDTE